MNKRPHKKMELWNKLMSLVEDIYKITGKFPREEVYVLTSQMRRAAVSTASNIAEGAARWSKQEKAHFYLISRGSLSELDAQLEICSRLKYIPEKTYADMCCRIDEVSSMLQGLSMLIKKDDQRLSAGIVR